MVKQRIAFVCQRYGLEVNGGAELHCRQLAERLTEFYDVEVITTCAVDYTTWQNSYRPGLSELNGVQIRRFKVASPRRPKKFRRISSDVIGTPHTSEQEEKWIKEQGPYSPECVEYLSAHYGDYHVVIFMTYLYYLTATCLHDDLIPNSLMIPTAHDEPPIYLEYFHKVFQNVKGIIYNTGEERDFCNKMFSINDTPSMIAGVGIETPDASTLFDTKTRYGLDDYILYLGRIDASKGCDKLFDYFIEYKKRVGGNVKLVLAGKSVMDIPKRNDIVPLGFVGDDEKFSLIKGCKALVLASEFESLSMVVLESLAYKKPVLVNGKCMVLKGHCRRSDAGLYFENYFEFEGALSYILTHESEAAEMGENGKNYVDSNYRWDVILKKICKMIDNFKIEET